jgi:hypothetical protein
LEPKIWRLALYDYEGRAHQFFYRIEGANIEAMNALDCTPDWSTELPMAKLLSALQSGETFTSMYFRINDMAFDPEVETKLAQVDFCADPLVRCLFTEDFAGYQKAQLKRILLQRNLVRC